MYGVATALVTLPLEFVTLTVIVAFHGGGEVRQEIAVARGPGDRTCQLKYHW